MTGSSPLTRGKQVVERQCTVTGGLIPAHAGKTAVDASFQVGQAAHPRSRGENAGEPTSASPRTGSSPLTRGKPRGRGRRHRRVGLIPAHAGKTYMSSQAGTPRAAHPRSRGENRPHDSHSPEIAGSSPLTRGKRSGVSRSRLMRGLIPAHAGKTRSCSSSPPVPGAHPRSRGENRMGTLRFLVVTGSSPLTRGKLSLDAWRDGVQRLIPAHAGKTLRLSISDSYAGAHPRSRGENRSSVPVPL